MEKQDLIMDDEMVMHETIANQVSISEQEDAYAALEAKYNNVEEEVEQDLLRAQFDRVEDMIGGAPEFVEEFEDNVIKENYIEEDSDGWGSIDDNPWHYKIFCVNGKYGIQNRVPYFLFYTFTK